MYLALIAASLLSQPALAPEGPVLAIKNSETGIPVDKRLWGIFFEEINCAGDGGIYAELVRNGSFEDSNNPDSWKFSEGISKKEIVPTGITGLNSKCLLVQFDIESAYIENGGYWGMAVRKGENYRLTFRSLNSNPDALLKFQLMSMKGGVIGQTVVRPKTSTDWAETSVSIKGTGNDPKAVLRVSGKPGQTYTLDNISLFPKTWKNRPNGLRPDLFHMLDGLKTAFVRFPGGCWVEGDTMATSMRWKQTIGKVADRRTLPNLWGYKSTNGLGFHEYLQMCEDLGAEPLFVINCGMSHKEVVPMDKMGEYVQDALDAIEYANGPTDSKWGAMRAQAGHPKPFGLRLMEIGNENGGPRYHERYALFAKAIKDKYPEIQLVACVWGGYPNSKYVDLVDEHYYNNPSFFFQNANRYDTYDRKGPKVYVGEYAVTQGCGNGNLIGALSEAAFMTGMERNSDVVVMSSYAPLFANVNHKGWNPDLIYFDSSRVIGTPSYYVQKLFSANRYDRNYPVKLSQAEFDKPTFAPGGIAMGTWKTQSEFKDINVISDGKVLFESADGAKLKKDKGTWTVKDGALVQSSDAEGARAYIEGENWTNYTLTCKAKKNSGDEGFLISIGYRNPQNWIWWNIGGWGNTKTALEGNQGVGPIVSDRGFEDSVETGKWYDIKVEFAPDSIKCYLNGKLTNESKPSAVPTLFASAGIDEKTGEMIVRIVNNSTKAQNVRIELSKPQAYEGKATVLTSALSTDENSLDEPNKVSPYSRKVRIDPKNPTAACPALSLTVLRLKPVAGQLGGTR